MDTTCIKVHAHGANPAGGQPAQGMGRTKGGLNTKLALIVDALGRPVAMQLAPRNRHDLKACAGLWRQPAGRLSLTVEVEAKAKELADARLKCYLDVAECPP